MSSPQLQLGPRLVVAGTHSGVGKTTVATGLMAAFRQQGLSVRSAKVGPDFIDPGYHSLATGHAPRNLDPWICGTEVIPSLAARAGADGDLLLVEGVMGLFDGAVDGRPSSTADVARLIDAPVVLVVDAASMSSSVAALVRGYRDHDPSLQLGGVILNRVGSEHHTTLLREALATIDVPVLGAVPRDNDLTWRDRHLGLVPIQEQGDEIVKRIEHLGSVLASNCDLARLLEVAKQAPLTTAPPPPLPSLVSSVRIAVATGPAFSFLYQDNLEALQAAGAEIVEFDPLIDSGLPPSVDGLIVGGGFPEVFANQLAENTCLLESVREAVLGGLPTWAECGGLLWLARALDDQPLCGVIPANGAMTSKLTLGYRAATVQISNPVAEAGTRLRGHEFHYTQMTPTGDALQLHSRFVDRAEGFASETLFATYLHQHLGGNPELAARFVRSCSGATDE